MASTLAKLTRPKLHRVVPRERLFDTLDRCRERPLTWVTGPPGGGKTSLLASYLQARKLNGLWYQIDAGDADLATFFHYLSEAAPAGTRKQPALPQLKAAGQTDPRGFARLYFRALFARFKGPSLIVLDNYHELPADAGLHALFDTIAREVPEGAGIAVISRQEPPPHCAALRAQDRLATLEWEALRLDLAETRRIAEQRQALSEAELAALYRDVEGWPVGLTLSLERARGNGAGIAAAPVGGREVLFDYFAGEIFADLSTTERQILACVALLRQATPDQAERLSGGREAGALLHELHRRRLFVDRVGDTYRFHDLFRAFLLQQFEQMHAPEAARERRRAAAALLSESDQIEDAFALSCGAQDWPAAAALLLGSAPRLFEQGRATTLRRWVAALPVPVIAASPWLGLWQGVSLSGIAPARAREVFAQCYERFPDDTFARTQSCAGVIISCYMEFDELATLDPWIDRILGLLATRPTFPSPGAELHAQSAVLFALGFRRPQPALLQACIARLYALFGAEAPVDARLNAASLLLGHYTSSAQMDQAQRLVALVAPWLADDAVNPFVRALWWMHDGYFEFRRGDTSAAHDAFERSLAIARDNALSVPLLAIYCHVGLALIAISRGDIAGAEALRQRNHAFWNPARRADSMADAGLSTYIHAQAGDAHAAVEAARRQLEAADGAGIHFYRFYSRVQLALLLRGGEADGEALPLLEQARALVDGTSYDRLGYVADLAEACVALDAGDFARADVCLARGLLGSRQDPGLWFLRLMPHALPPLLARALSAGIDTDYARMLIRRFALKPPTTAVPDWPWPLEVRTLGRFEVRRDGEPLAFSRKVPRKTLALLKALIAFGGSGVSAQKLFDALWPDEEGDVAARSLDATVLRLRQLLGDAGCVIAQGGKLALDRERIHIDVFAFEAALAAAGAAARQQDAPAFADWERALSLYQGTFLAEDDGESWPIATRERLRGRYIHALDHYAQELERQERTEAAIAAYQRGLDADPVIESFYQGLMRCYQRLDRRTEAISAYRRLRQTLSVTLGIAPSAASEKLFRTLR